VTFEAARAVVLEPEFGDAELIALAQTGHVEAFAKVYDRYAPKVLAIARRILGAGCDADDLLHDVFLEAWQSVRDYDATRASVLTWLSMRTRSRAADRLARRSRERHAQRVLFEAELEPSHLRTALEITLAARTAVAELESPLPSAIELMYVAGLTAPEISVRMGIAEGTVRSRLARGLSKLERTLR
jgi:RNA polymerase sigma-70 factor (ECF subfamily)